MKQTDAQKREKRRKSQHQYYITHREQFRAYWRKYREDRKRGVAPGTRSRNHLDGTSPIAGRPPERPATRTSHTRSDLMHLPTEKAARVIGKIIRGEHSLV